MAATTSVPDAEASGQDRGHECTLRVVGFLSGGGGVWVGVHGALLTPLPSFSDCQSPLVLACRSCPRARAIPCRSHSLARCAPCALRYRRLVTRVVEGGLSDRSGPGWHLYLLTLTAPGTTPGHLRLSPHAGRKFLPMHGPRPVCGCEHSMISLGRWNATAGETWNRLRTNLRRDYPGLQFMRLVEDQKRGALHHHVLVASLHALDPADVQARAVAAGYGCSVDLDPVRDRRGTAKYVSKYAAKQVDERALVPWERDLVDCETGEIRVDTRPNYRNVSRSADWWLSMAAIKSILRERVKNRRLAAESGDTPQGLEDLETLTPQALSPPST